MAGMARLRKGEIARLSQPERLLPDRGKIAGLAK
jgi:hypothetical protein